MQLQEIPTSQWNEFLDQFSRLHRGQAADISSAAMNEEPQSVAQGLPLLGVTAEHSSQDGQRIDVIAASAEAGHVRHAILNPTHLRACEWNDGASAELRIERADGETTLLRVGPEEQTLPPGFITDGLYSGE
jgi:hypothetical protein